mmetsp:Transcript_18638/g.35898  ORF Transcript_18638/g.35898 Transcript_18638/m.35898 type:complete len:122 (-) Transcript_18638:204-569(-)
MKNDVCFECLAMCHAQHVSRQILATNACVRPRALQLFGSETTTGSQLDGLDPRSDELRGLLLLTLRDEIFGLAFACDGRRLGGSSDDIWICFDSKLLPMSMGMDCRRNIDARVDAGTGMTR